jgi:hypothetical protein
MNISNGFAHHFISTILVIILGKIKIATDLTA